MPSTTLTQDQLAPTASRFSRIASLGGWSQAWMTVAWLLGLPLLPTAQCPTSDQLDAGACHTDASFDVPGFPRFSQDALQVCWLDCGVDQVIPGQAEWQNLRIRVYPDCGTRYARLRIVDANGLVTWLGYKLRLEYSRTWLETDDSGDDHQVWRFLVNGDLTPGPGAASTPCSRPSCIPVLGKARFTGYLDYARECAAGTYQFAWMLSHLCDQIDHAAGFERSGTYHPDRSYTLVGPALGFVPGAPVPFEATAGSPFDALRQRPIYPVPGGEPCGPWRATASTCASEEPSSHALLPVQQSCFCTPGGQPMFSEGSLSVMGSCGTSITSPGGPFLSGFLSMTIGAWTDPTRFPGAEALRWNAGNYGRVVPPQIPPENEVYFGVTTLGGWAGTQILGGGSGSPLPSTYIDQGSSKRFVCGARGGLVPATALNLPYVSDSFINLNH